MSKVLKTVATVAGAVALVATGVGAVGVGAILGAKTAAVAGIASVVSALASVGAQLTAPKPIARGSTTNVLIDTEPPRPYMIGESYSAGILRHRVGYGPTLKKVPNPFLWEVKVFSGVGPVESLVQEQFDFGSIGSYYSGFYSSDTQLGARPESGALVPPLNAPATGWGANHRLSGCAAIGGNYKFDKDGKVFASGTPLHGAIWRGEKVYDPRLDSTYPGGSGACRLGTESTYVYSANPALHAGTYAFGRYENGIKVFGLGLAEDGIDWAAIVDWANDCDTNEWTAHGTIYEGGRGANLRDQRIQNLDDICAAGGGRWLTAGALLSFDWHRPRVPLATLTDDDLLEEGGNATAVQSLRDRMNGVRPQYVSPSHNWEQITADEIIGSTYRTEDGQPLTQTWALNLVKSAAQAGELASYALVDSREIGPIEIAAKAEWRFYKPGETITVNSTLLGYNGPAVIVKRDFDPQSLAVKLVLKSETAAKHDFALGKVAVPPPTPTLLQTQEERDLAVYGAITPRAVDVEYDDGTTSEALKPGQAGSTRNVAQGTYDAGTTYVLGDEVLFSGSSYRLIVASSTGNAPPDALRWALLANAGSGPAGADGLEGITIIVTNEAHVVATAEDGTGGDYTGAGGTMTLRRGSTVLSPAFSIAAQSPASPSWITIDPSSGAYTVSDPGVDYATATIRAVWNSVNYDRTYTIAKSKQGVTGPRLALTVDNQAFTFTNGAANPASQTITLTALLNNLSGTATWTTTPSVTLGGSGNTRTLSVANFGTNRQVTVEATLGGITDKITVVRLERDPNTDITVDGSGNLVGIGTPNVPVDNSVVVRAGLLAARPASGAFVGQTYFATDALVLFRWDGSAWTSGPTRNTGALADLDTVDLASQVTNRSLANLDSAADTKLGGIQAGATLGATWGSNLAGRPAELTDGRIVTGLRSDGSLQSGIWAGAASVPASELLEAGLTGKRIARDPDFAQGNPLFLYNNSGNDAINLARVADPSAPNGSGHIIRVSYDGVGPTNPSFGGAALRLDHASVSRPGFYAEGTKVVYVLRAKIPVGRSLYWTSNLTGNGSTGGFLTGNAGTGDWQIYLYQRTHGVGGTLAPTGYWFISGGSDTAFSWDIALADCREIGSTDVPSLDRLIDGTGAFRGDTDLLNTNVVRAGLASARPASGSFDGQTYYATDTQVLSRWNGSAWVDGPNRTTNTSQLTDGAGLGTTAVWTSVTSRPNNLADLDSSRASKLDGVQAGATVGATWGTNLAGRPAELTDGRIAAGLNASGDVARNLPTTIKSLINLDEISDGSTNRFFLNTEKTKLGTVETNADVTANAQRTIEPQFPVIEIKEGEAGNSGTRTVTHTLYKGTTAQTGVVWSIASNNTGGTCTVNSSTGQVSLSGITASGAYTIRAAKDGFNTDHAVNTTFVPTPAAATPSAKTGAASNTNGWPTSWTNVVSLTLSNCPAGRLFFNQLVIGGNSGSDIRASTGTGTCTHRARLLVNGAVVQTTAAKTTISGGAVQFANFNELFANPRAVPAGTVTVAIQIERTSGTGSVSSATNSLDVNVIAS